MKRTVRIAISALTICGLASCAGKKDDDFMYTNPPEPKQEFVKRAAPPTMAPDDRAIDTSQFPKSLNERDESHGTIHASSDGGCHVFVDDGEMRPPGMTGPRQVVQCSDDMMQIEWGYCTGADTLHTNDAGNECICYHNGNPPPPPSRVTCPGQSQPATPRTTNPPPPHSEGKPLPPPPKPPIPPPG